MDNPQLPRQGMPRDEVLARLRAFKGNDANFADARTWSLVYYLGEEHTQFLADAYREFFSENALNPMAFQSLKRLEHEVVRMTAGLLGGDGDVVGTMTSGGTETCLLPVLTYRDRAAASGRVFRRRGWGRRGQPEMIAPASIHVAWEKAARYFGVKLVHAPLRDDCRVDVDAVRRLINQNTIMLVASAPSYPHGVIDPVEELGALALEHDLPLHVDACLGGFLLPFLKELGHGVPRWDFSVPGVTSIGADVHKYGYAAKGASVLLYRNMDYLKHQFFVSENWPGGIFISPALLGTRPGGAIAAAWASLQAIGYDGYVELARQTMAATAALQAGIRAIAELEIVSNPDMSVFAYRARGGKVSIYAVADQLEQRGWLVDRLQRPEALHLMVTPRHAAVVDTYLADLREAVAAVRSNPALGRQGNAALYGMIAKLPLRGVVRNEVLKMMEKMYGPKLQLPY